MMLDGNINDDVDFNKDVDEDVVFGVVSFCYDFLCMLLQFIFCLSLSFSLSLSCCRHFTALVIG